MRLIQIPLLLAIAALSSASFAADDQRIAHRSSSKANPLSQPAIVSLDSDSGIFLGLPDSRESSPGDVSWNRKPSWQLPLNPARDVCYTMRTYKVKMTERLSENESGSRGYSTCLFAREYQIRSADIKGKSAESSGAK
jgi:hypothetical protein